MYIFFFCKLFNGCKRPSADIQKNNYNFTTRKNHDRIRLREFSSWLNNITTIVVYMSNGIVKKKTTV